MIPAKAMGSEFLIPEGAGGMVCPFREVVENDTVSIAFTTLLSVVHVPDIRGKGARLKEKPACSGNVRRVSVFEKKAAVKVPFVFDTVYFDRHREFHPLTHDYFAGPLSDSATY